MLNDNCLILPSIIPLDPIIQKEFIKDIVDILFPIKKNEAFDLPVWTKNYFLKEEINTENNIKNFIQERVELDKKISREQEQLNEIKNKKILFSGTGNSLEFEVEKIFIELGFKVLEREPNRDDLIVEYKSKIAVIEIKGVTKSAAEKQAAQLYKWVSDYHSKNEVEPKGILIINTHKDLELIHRKFEDFFPDQMLGYVNRQKLCLISTTQLLGLYYDIQENPHKKESLIETLFSTIGVYEHYRDWTKFIELNNKS